MLRITAGLAALAALAISAPAMAQTVVATAASSTQSTSGADLPVQSAPAPPKAESPAKAAAPAAPPKPATTLAVDINLTSQRLSVSENGKAFGSWAISSGREGYRSPTGTFRPIWSSKMWYSKKYDNAPMPHAVFFTGGVALHATQATGMLGRPASHGCIRQSPSNAETLYKLIAKHGNAHTKIVVHGTPRDSEPRMARSQSRSTDRRLADREPLARLPQRPATFAAPAMRRVIMVDASGNRRIAEIPANDPRLLAYQMRVRQASGGGYGRSAW
jgi:lipoprotein-anchoring transpeptidase ErfK/SrfK